MKNDSAIDINLLRDSLKNCFNVRKKIYLRVIGRIYEGRFLLERIALGGS
jgi:hypothetical protein